jgi:putative hemolysin
MEQQFRIPEVAAAEDAIQLASEIESLPASQTLYCSGSYQVLWVYQKQAPSVVREIGRLREINFRQVGEGTGNERDLDVYDEWYLHLLVWERDLRRVLGAYRLGKTDVILRERGRSGLYTDSLFNFDTNFLQFMCPALEMGRSFVDQSYQRYSRVLAFLWRGIGQIVAAEPKYHRLFGPVSVSSLYREQSRCLIASQLMNGPFRHEWANYVVPLRGFGNEAPNELLSVQHLNARVSELEPDGKGLPTLVKEYIKLGGRFLAFSVDPDFGNALDGLVTVDLLQTEERLLNLFMGPEAHATFKRAHGLPVSAVRKVVPRDIANSEV